MIVKPRWFKEGGGKNADYFPGNGFASPSPNGKVLPPPVLADYLKA